MIEKVTCNSEIFSSLNDSQAKAVSTVDGALLVLAGAGTGKTKVLTSRIANLISLGVNPHNILAVTFTNKAAKEMAERIERMVGSVSKALWLGTFHSIAAKILRSHSKLVDIENNFVIISPDDSLRLVKQILKEFKVSEEENQPKSFLYLFNKWKDKALTPDKVKGTYIVHDDPALVRADLFYAEYQNRLRQLNACDFGDLLLHNITIFNNHPEILSYYQQMFRYILVDEYQDTNIIQYLWLRLLASGNSNICCVGDDDQSIYGWRGAEVGNILRFEKDFKGAKIVKLEQNYRSTGNILAAASSLIAKNSSRLGKTLWTSDQSGEKVKLTTLRDERDEARFIADEIELLQRNENIRAKDIAILVRTGTQTRTFEECFINRGIAYKVIGGLKFYERMEIRDVIAYLRVIFQNNDDLALERIINIPKRGIGSSTLHQIREFARANEMAMLPAIKLMLEQDLFKGKLRGSLESLGSMFDRFKQYFAELDVTEATKKMLNESLYLKMWQDEATVEAEGRVDNINELVRALGEFLSIENFLEYISLVSDSDDTIGDDTVSIMTIHAAKGLEFEVVFLPGWEQGLFPHQRSIAEKANEGIEEERRLAYVGITRARKRAYISNALVRQNFGNFQYSTASQFIAEIDKNFTEYYDMNFSSELKQNYQSNNSQPKTQNGKTRFFPGMRVFHIKFGYGKVIKIFDSHVEISFEKAGYKTVLIEYLQPA